MGIVGLWDILGEGHITPIAAFAAEHFQKTGRPLRIAIDEAGWRFNNLSPFQVAKIREKEPRAHPIEKAIFWRLVQLLRLNIQVIFIFDGPHRPWKRGGVAGRIDWKQIDLLRKLLDVFGIPHHRAPAEAEAECARMQELGLVDAVWSDDGDTLMFGCGVLVRAHHDAFGKKSDTLIRVYRAANIEEKHSLDRSGLVLFAMLSGGDYDTKGVKGCGPQLALKAAQHGLGRTLCEATEDQLPSWKEMLIEFFQGRPVVVPSDFPRFKHLKNYRTPQVSSLEQLNNLRGLRSGWNKPLNEEKLRDFLGAYFNIWTRGYLKHIAPILLVRSLVQKSPEQRASNYCFGVQLVKQRKKQDGACTAERKITYLPLAVTTVDASVQPVGEDWSIFASQDGTRYDPSQRIECEVLECILRHGLPDDVFNSQETVTPKAANKKTSKAGQTNDGTIQPAKRGRRSDKDGDPEQAAKKQKRTTKSSLQSNPSRFPDAVPFTRASRAEPSSLGRERLVISLDSDTDSDHNDHDQDNLLVGRTSLPPSILATISPNLPPGPAMSNAIEAKSRGNAWKALSRVHTADHGDIEVVDLT